MEESYKTSSEPSYHEHHAWAFSSFRKFSWNFQRFFLLAMKSLTQPITTHLMSIPTVTSTVRHHTVTSHQPSISITHTIITRVNRTQQVTQTFKTHFIPTIRNRTRIRIIITITVHTKVIDQTHRLPTVIFCGMNWIRSRNKTKTTFSYHSSDARVFFDKIKMNLLTNTNNNWHNKHIKRIVIIRIIYKTSLKVTSTSTPFPSSSLVKSRSSWKEPPSSSRESKHRSEYSERLSSSRYRHDPYRLEKWNRWTEKDDEV